MLEGVFGHVPTFAMNRWSLCTKTLMAVVPLNSSSISLLCNASLDCIRARVCISTTTLSSPSNAFRPPRFFNSLANLYGIILAAKCEQRSPYSPWPSKIPNK